MAGADGRGRWQEQLAEQMAGAGADYFLEKTSTR